MADLNALTKKLGSIQRQIVSWLHANDGKELCAVDYCEQHKLRDSERDRVYKAVQSLKMRGLISSRKIGRNSIIDLTGKGHAAAYAILEDDGQMRLPIGDGLQQAGPANVYPIRSGAK